MIITATYFIVLIIALVLTAIATVLDADSLAKKYNKSGLNLIRNIIIVVLLIAIVYLCIQNFPTTLTFLVIFTGVIALIDQLFFWKKRRLQQQQPSVIVENSRSFFPVLLLVWIIRSFIIQPYHVPTGSLEPTIIAGDFIVVDQYSYGLHFPIMNKKFLNIGEPKEGDIALFYWPGHPETILIKRIVGVPGDHIVYKNKVLTINGIEATQKFTGTAYDVEPNREPIPVNVMEEDLNGVKHKIYLQPFGGETKDFDIIVPKDMYFAMGDNRDDSDDSRMWGYVPQQNLIGKGLVVWLSWDANKHRIRWHRIGTVIH